MKAAMIDAHTGDLAAVQVRDVEVPKPGRGQLRVRMRMAPVNPSDFNYINGTYEQAFARMIWNRKVERPTGPDGNPAPAPP